MIRVCSLNKLALSSQIRNYFFSNQSEELKKIQVDNKYSSDFWVPANINKTYNKGTGNKEPYLKVKQGEKPIIVRLPKVVSYYNKDDLVYTDALKKELENSIYKKVTNVHMSMKSKKAYLTPMSNKLEERYVINNNISRWWITSAQIKYMKLEAKVWKKPSDILFSGLNEEVYNLDQIENKDEILSKCYSGGTGSIYPSNHSLYEYHKKQSFSTSVYYTSSQLKYLNLVPKVDAVPFDYTMESTRNKDGTMLYNITALKDWKKIITTLISEWETNDLKNTVREYYSGIINNNTKSNSTHYYINGFEINNDEKIKLLSQSDFKINIWLNSYHIKKYKYVLENDTLNVMLKVKNKNYDILFYNLDQLENKSAAKEKFGLLLK